MKVRILSDVHLEFGNLRCRQGDEDVVVLAGDIGVGAAGMPWARATFPDKPIVYVAGNHEFYGRDIAAGYDKLAESAAKHGVYFLQDAFADIGGVRFIGATLWTDFNLFGDAPVAEAIARGGINDFRLIKDGAGPITTERWRSMHAVSRAFIDAALSAPFAGQKVVVTHHLPSIASVPLRFKLDAFSPAYASRMEDVVVGGGAVIWVHGHTHDSVDYTLGTTRVVANPRGYAGHELNSNFDAEMSVTVEVCRSAA